MAEVDDGNGVGILAEDLGGTPINLGLSFLKDEKVAKVAGANVPMLLTLSSYRRGRSLKEISELIKESGRGSIVLAIALSGLKKRMRAKSDLH
jgi:PTS system mannose-specific IIA component